MRAFNHKSNRLLNLLISILFSILLTAMSIGCQKSETNSDRFESKPEVRAANAVSASFGVSQVPQAVNNAHSVTSATPDLSSDKARIVIQKSALEKEFLFRGSVLQQVPVAMFTGLQSRVVAFRLRNNKVYMLEATQGHSVTPDMPQNLILAEFELISENTDSLVFDFNSGMSQLYTATGWYSQEDSGSAYDANYNFQSTKVKHSFIESAEVTAENELSIRQIASLEMNSPKPMEGQINVPIEARYFLSPYRPTTNFHPKTSTKQKLQFGFFEALPTVDSDGNTNIFATKHAHESGMTYAISSNTPEDMRETVKEGILYWNKAFGSEIVKVVDAPAGASAPDSRFNIIQWINWDQAGMAYADAQMDPRTGEIKNAQVFMTSAFQFFGKVRARRLLKTIQDSRRMQMAKVMLKGFLSHGLCQFPMSQSIESGLERALAEGSSEERVTQMAKDYVRMVVAHEVGHTMGLRHNFAGSMGANFSLSDKANILTEYLKTGSLADGLIASSSVMEYSEFFDDVIDGRAAQVSKTALPYDEKAIQNLYFNKSFAQKDTPLFCTDDWESKYLDCATFDVGRSPVEFANKNFDEQVQGLPRKLVETFVSAKAPFRGIDSQSTDVATLPSVKDSVYGGLLLQQYKVAQALTDKGQILKIQRQFSSVSEINREEVRSKEQQYLSDEFQLAGGMTEVFKRLPADFVEQSSKKFSQLIQSPLYKSGKGLANQDYEFSDDEIVVAETRATAYFKNYFDFAQKAQAELLAAKNWEGKPEHGKLVASPAAESYAGFLKDRATDLLLSTTGKGIETEVSVGDKGSKKIIKVTLPEFNYRFEVRTLAAGMLNSERSQDFGWAVFERRSQNQIFHDFYQKILTVDLDKIDPNDLNSRAAARWILENQAVAKALVE